MMQMWSDGEGTGMLIESQTVFLGSDFRRERTVLLLLNPTAVTQPNLSLYQDTHSFRRPSGGITNFLPLSLRSCRGTQTTLLPLVLSGSSVPSVEIYIDNTKNNIVIRFASFSFQNTKTELYVRVETADDAAVMCFQFFIFI